MIASRYKNDGRSIVPLRPKQRKAREKLLHNLRFKYHYVNRLCACGGNDYELLSEKDAFGIPQKVVICKACGLIQVSPCCDQDAYADFYRDIYPQLYGDNQDLRNLYFDLTSRGVWIYEFVGSEMSLGVRYFDVQKSVMEIGCSAGGILEAFRNGGCQVFGTDYDQAVIDYGRGQGLDLFCGHSDQLGVEHEKKYDLIILSHVFEHFVNIDYELKQIRRLLKNGGALYIEVPSIYSSIGNVQSDFLDYLEFDHVYYFGLDTLESTLRFFGFKMVAGVESPGHAACAVFKVNEIEKNQRVDDSNNFEGHDCYHKTMARLLQLEHEYEKNKFKHFVIRLIKFLPLRYKVKVKSIVSKFGISTR